MILISITDHYDMLVEIVVYHLTKNVILDYKAIHKWPYGLIPNTLNNVSRFAECLLIGGWSTGL